LVRICSGRISQCQDGTADALADHVTSHAIIFGASMAGETDFATGGESLTIMGRFLGLAGEPQARGDLL
jgi:hypothetical protein